MPARKKMAATITMTRSTFGLILVSRFEGGGVRNMNGGAGGKGGGFIFLFWAQMGRKREEDQAFLWDQSYGVL